MNYPRKKWVSKEVSISWIASVLGNFLDIIAKPNLYRKWNEVNSLAGSLLLYHAKGPTPVCMKREKPLPLLETSLAGAAPSPAVSSSTLIYLHSHYLTLHLHNVIKKKYIYIFYFKRAYKMKFIYFVSFAILAYTIYNQIKINEINIRHIQFTRLNNRKKDGTI